MKVASGFCPFAPAPDAIAMSTKPYDPTSAVDIEAVQQTQEHGERV